jgi:two-component system NarL family sensor kinase
MFVAGRLITVLYFVALNLVAFSQRETFRSGPQAVKTIEEIKKLDGSLKAEETLKLIRNSNTQASSEVYELIEESLRLARDFQRPDLIGSLLCGKGVLKLQETDTASALKNFQLAENYLQQVTDRRFADNILNALAIGYLRSGNGQKSVEMNLRLLNLYEDVPENRMRRLFAYRNLSNGYMRLQKTKEALAAMETALSYAEQTNNEQLIQDVKLASASMYAMLNDYDRSFTLLKNVIPAINKLPAKASETLYRVLAQTYQKQGEYVKSNEYYRKTTSSANHFIAVSAYVNLILNSDKVNETDSLENYFRALQSLSFADQKTTPQYYLAVSKYYAYKQNTSQQIRWLKKLIASDKSSPFGIEGFIQLGKYYSSKGEKDTADQFFKLASLKSNSIRNDQNLYSTYLSSLKEHQLRYKASDSLISILNAEIKLKDSLQKSNMFTVTKDLETHYKVSEKEYQLNQLAQQQKLDQLKLKQQQQQKWISFLVLAVVLIAFGCFAFILNTKKKQAHKIHELEVLSLKNKHQVELMQALDKAQEKERRSIADKLHDEVGAMLSVLKLNLSGKTNTSTAEKSLQTSLTIVDTLAGEIRNLSHTLMPVVVEKYGMIRGIKDLTEQINTSGKLRTELIVTGFDNEHSIAINVQMHIYRIVQELMNNIIKHSGATNALIQLVEHDESVSLVVEDNGKGLTQNNDSGNGLHVLNSKVMLLNGEMNVDSQVGNGTSFIIEIPKNTNTPLLYAKNQNNVSG